MIYLSYVVISMWLRNDSMSKVVKGEFVSLRPVELSDAEFIVSIRNIERNARYINKTSTDIQAQIDWMIQEKSDPTSYYFLIVDEDDQKIGTISIYNIDDSRGEFGRWICSGNALQSLESALLIHRYAFERLGLKEVYTRTLAENKKVVSFHRQFGALLPQKSVFESEYGKDIYPGLVTFDMFPKISERCKKMIEAFK